MTLRRWDRAMNGRRSVLFPWTSIKEASLARRGVLEERVDSRVLGVGTHNGATRPGWRRIGIMMGRDVTGKQFWAVAAGPRDTKIVVVALADHDFTRAVLEVDDPTGVVREITSRASA